MNQTVLALLAHPDDAEILCAGTLIRLSTEFGWRVAIATMTAGDCGSAEHSAEEISRIRQSEAAAAAELLGATYHCVGARDLCVMYDEPTLTAVTRLFRKIRPNLVITHSPDDYHLDHEGASRLARAACFAAPVPLFRPDPQLPPLNGTPHLYYCDPVEGKDIFGRSVEPQFIIDIVNTIELKTQMLACHASQRNWLLKHHGIDSYLDSMRSWSGQRGQSAGLEFGEGFRQHLGHGYPQSNLLQRLFSDGPAPQF